MEKLQLKIKRNKFFSKRRITIVIVLLFMLSLGIGYAILVSDLGMNGTISMKEYNAPTLYNVLKREAVEGGLAREYTGEHHDSFTEEPSKKIYHYYSNSSSDSNKILNKNNVLFAGFCWQMYRTTDTGGVKLLYNGKSQDNQCVTRSQAEYFTNDVTTDSLSSNYWYGTDYEYDKTTNKFVLTGDVNQYTLSAETASNIIGKYTCKSTDRDGCSYQIYYPYLYKDDNTAELLKLYHSSNNDYIGYLPFNNFNESMGDGGYMYGDMVYVHELNDYSKNAGSGKKTVYMYDFSNTSSDYYVADSVTYDSSTGKYTLNNPVLQSTITNKNDLVGKYTFISTSSSNSSSSVYYIFKGQEGSTNYIINYHSFYGGETTFTNMYIGDSYSDNGNGTYTISNAVEVGLLEWYDNDDNYKDKYYCSGSNTCTNPKMIVSAGKSSFKECDMTAKILIAKDYYDSQLQDTLLISVYEHLFNFDSYKDYIYTCGDERTNCAVDEIRVIQELDISKDYYKYRWFYYLGDGVTWDGTEYTLTNVKPNIPPDTHRYICLEKGKKKCTKAAYIVEDYWRPYLILENGKTTLQDVLDSTLANNINDSPTKAGIEAWFKKHMASYSTDLEDTIFCNNRSIAKYGPFAPFGTMSEYFTFYGGDTQYDYDLSCPLVTDQFAVANNQAKLSYKVGMATYPEMNLMGNSGGSYYGSFRVMTPQHWTKPRVYMRMASNGSSLSSWYEEPVRPVISLKLDTEYSTGTGTKENPYVVGESHTITTDSNLFKHMKKAVAGWTVKLESDEYIVTSFKVNGTLVEGESFVMPDEDVEITDIEYSVANYNITVNDDTVTAPSTGRYNTTITLDAGNNYLVSSFKLNGTSVEGNSFTMPAEDVVISDIVRYIGTIVESEHNPYPDNLNSVVYYENTFEGAETISVELTYQTYSSSDYVYIYDSPDGQLINNQKYSSSSKTTTNITLNSNYIKIVFNTDNYYNPNYYYGFKAVIRPNYRLNITNTNSLFNIPTSAVSRENVSITSDDYIVTSFKINGTLVEGDSFVMPYEPVTITDIQYIQANYTITNTNSSITVPSTGRYGTTITLETDESHAITSFKLNGELIQGYSFTMPAENVTITDVKIAECIIAESEHNPYPNSMNNVVYYENTFNGATSITVELTYQTEGTLYDWIYLYGSAYGSPIGNKKYGGSTKKTETITVNSNYLKIVFKTDGIGNNYYGFKAVIIPNYS